MLPPTSVYDKESNLPAHFKHCNAILDIISIPSNVLKWKDIFMKWPENVVKCRTVIINTVNQIGVCVFTIFSQKPCSASFDTVEWKECISQPSLPYVLKMLAGLCHWHAKTQEALEEVIPELHLLEQVASEQHIGTLAENLLEVMADHPACYEEVGCAQLD